METKEIRMKIRSLRYDVEESLFAQMSEEMEEDDTLMRAMEAGDLSFDEEEKIELNTEGERRIHDGRVEFVYEESEITGMEGSSTMVYFDLSDPGLVSMVRTGSVSTALVFEAGKRHHCVYNTPIMPFEICVYASCVDNRLLQDGILELDYIIEIRGAQAERTRFTMEIRTADEADPLPRPEIMLKNLQ